MIIGKGVEGSGRNLMWGSVPAFRWSGYGKQRNFLR